MCECIEYDSGAYLCEVCYDEHKSLHSRVERLETMLLGLREWYGDYDGTLPMEAHAAISHALTALEDQ